MDNNQNYYNNNQNQPYGNQQGYHGGYYNQYNTQYNYQHHRIYSNPQQGYVAYNNYNYNQQRYNVYPGGYSYYQNLYNMFGGYNPIVDREFTEISRRGTMAGALVLGIFLMQVVASLTVSLFPVLSDYYYADVTFSEGMGIFMQFIYMLVPALVVFFISKPEDRMDTAIFGKPKSGPLCLLGIFAGFALCLLGDAATSVFSVILNIFGVTFYSGFEDMEIPTTAVGIIIFIVNLAVMPALLEEFAFRGVLMQPLRKYGDWFAILASSFCFAIVHANMVQIPFAFIAGIALGYFCIKTKSIWTSVIIHFLNNFLAALTSIYYDKYPDASLLIYYAVTIAFVLLGVVAMLVFRKSCTVRTKKDATAMSKNKSLKIASFVTVPTVLIAFFYAVFNSISLTETTNLIGVLTLIALLGVAGFFIIRFIRVIQKQKTIKQKPMYTVSLILTIISCLFLGLIALFTLSL